VASGGPQGRFAEGSCSGGSCAVFFVAGLLTAGFLTGGFLAVGCAAVGCAAVGCAAVGCAVAAGRMTRFVGSGVGAATASDPASSEPEATARPAVETRPPVAPRFVIPARPAPVVPLRSGAGLPAVPARPLARARGVRALRCAESSAAVSPAGSSEASVPRRSRFVTDAGVTVCAAVFGRGFRGADVFAAGLPSAGATGVASVSSSDAAGVGFRFSRGSEVTPLTYQARVHRNAARAENRQKPCLGITRELDYDRATTRPPSEGRP
jgi:hypothetical protein